MGIWCRLRNVIVLATLAATVVPFGVGARTVEAQSSTTTAQTTKKPAPQSKTGSASGSTGKTTGTGSKKTTPSKSTKGKSRAASKTNGAATASRKPTAQTIRLNSAFKATEQLRPMAQQLATTRSAAAYSGVENYARMHPGEGAAAAYLALGHAYMLDHRYADAAGDVSQGECDRDRA